MRDMLSPEMGGHINNPRFRSKYEDLQAKVAWKLKMATYKKVLETSKDKKRQQAIYKAFIDQFKGSAWTPWDDKEFRNTTIHYLPETIEELGFNEDAPIIKPIPHMKLQFGNSLEKALKKYKFKGYQKKLRFGKDITKALKKFKMPSFEKPKLQFGRDLQKKLNWFKKNN